MRTQSICLALAIVLLCPLASAQWVQLGLAERRIGDIAVGSSGLFAVTSDSGSMFRTTDGGVNWIQAAKSGVSKIAISPTGTIYMVKWNPLVPYWSDSLYRSSDGATTWSNLRVVEQVPPGPMAHTYPTRVALGPTGKVFCGIVSGQMAGGTTFSR